MIRALPIAESPDPSWHEDLLEGFLIGNAAAQSRFLGASVKGPVVKQSEDLIDAFYGGHPTAEDLLVKRKVSPPAEAEAFMKAVDKETKRSS